MNINASRVAEGNAAPDRSAEYRDAWFAMRLSLLFGFLMLAAKTVAYFLTRSSAILADAAESVVHVIGIVFAAFSLRLSMRPATPNFLYGFERIAFFSAGFEGAMVVLAAIVIIVTAVQQWLAGLHLENLGIGSILVLAATGINAVLGWYLVRTGRRLHSLILVANGKHVLTQLDQLRRYPRACPCTLDAMDAVRPARRNCGWIEYPLVGRSVDLEVCRGPFGLFRPKRWA